MWHRPSAQPDFDICGGSTYTSHTPTRQEPAITPTSPRIGTGFRGTLYYVALNALRSATQNLSHQPDNVCGAHCYLTPGRLRRVDAPTPGSRYSRSPKKAEGNNLWIIETESGLRDTVPCALTGCCSPEVTS